MTRSINNLFLWFLLVSSLVFALLGCDRSYDPVFNESPDQRVRKQLSQYDSLLIGAPYGWKAMLYTGTGKGFFYYFAFKGDGSVTMWSDFDTATAGKAMNGNWVLKALQQPTLSFSTYSYVHLPADPDGTVNGGPDGVGQSSDFEFAFSRMAGDSVFLKGILRNTELILLKASSAEASAIASKRIETLLQETGQYTRNNRGLRLELPDGNIVPLAINVEQKMFAAQYLSGDGGIQEHTSAFTFSTTGLLLKSPVRIGNYSWQELFWNEEKKLYFANLEGANREISNSAEPFIFRPGQALHQVIGTAYTGIQLPQGSGTAPITGQSDAFVEVYKEVADLLLAGQYKLTLQEMNIVFKPATNTMLLDVFLMQSTNDGSSQHLAEYIYSYQKTAEGVFKFTSTGGNQNAFLISFEMQKLLERLENDTFKVEYVGGGLSLLGGLFSQQNPEFYFSGYLYPFR